jgi:hypothetical protein
MVSDLVGPAHGEAEGNLALFQSQAGVCMCMLLADLAPLVPYLAARRP